MEDVNTHLNLENIRSRNFVEVENICMRNGAIEARIPSSERAKRRLLEARENFYHALKRHAIMEIIDTVVPRSEINRFISGEGFAKCSPLFIA